MLVLKVFQQEKVCRYCIVSTFARHRWDNCYENCWESLLKKSHQNKTKKKKKLKQKVTFLIFHPIIYFLSNFHRFSFSPSYIFLNYNLSGQHTIRRSKGMATLQRAKVYRRQGSSGPVWDEKYLLVEDKVEYRELRPCRSSLNIRNVDCSGSIAAAPPISCPRSLSTPATNQTFSGGSGKGFGIPKSKSGKRKLFLAKLPK